MEAIHCPSRAVAFTPVFLQLPKINSFKLPNTWMYRPRFFLKLGSHTRLGENLSKATLHTILAVDHQRPTSCEMGKKSRRVKNRVLIPTSERTLRSSQAFDETSFLMHRISSSQLLSVCLSKQKKASRDRFFSKFFCLPCITEGVCRSSSVRSRWIVMLSSKSFHEGLLAW